jgi:hypothetical protein
MLQNNTGSEDLRAQVCLNTQAAREILIGVLHAGVCESEKIIP